MAINLCDATCNDRFHVLFNPQCFPKFRNETIAYLIAVKCSTSPLATSVFDNADGASGDAAFLALLNSAVGAAGNATVMPVVEYEFPEPEVAERKYISCKSAFKRKHSQKPVFTVNLAIDAVDAPSGIVASNEIGRHRIGELYNLENAIFAMLQEYQHIYYVVTCDGKLFFLGNDAGNTALPMLASVGEVINSDDPMDRYVQTTLTLESTQWLRDPKVWTPRAVLNSVTMAGLSTLQSYITL